MKAIRVVTAIEKDSSGNIFAQGRYEYEPGISGGSYCSVFVGYTNLNGLISFSDMKHTSDNSVFKRDLLTLLFLFHYPQHNIQAL